ncbi:YceK/YidQ family lipoprotein [Enterobacter sp. R1(2018)]|nr:YceK/YidQ family lipoprotein [Enterobacter sp. R1(2018)]
MPTSGSAFFCAHPTDRYTQPEQNRRQALLRAIVVIMVACLLSGCGSIISRAVPGQGHGNQYYPGVQWDVRDSAWRYITVLDLPFSLVFDTLLLPIDASHGPYE